MWEQAYDEVAALQKQLAASAEAALSLHEEFEATLVQLAEVKKKQSRGSTAAINRPWMYGAARYAMPCYAVLCYAMLFQGCICRLPVEDQVVGARLHEYGDTTLGLSMGYMGMGIFL